MRKFNDDIRITRQKDNIDDIDMIENYSNKIYRQPYNYSIDNIAEGNILFDDNSNKMIFKIDGLLKELVVKDNKILYQTLED